MSQSQPLRFSTLPPGTLHQIMFSKFVKWYDVTFFVLNDAVLDFIVLDFVL